MEEIVSKHFIEHLDLDLTAYISLSERRVRAILWFSTRLPVLECG
jgi:hypothetical protein